jgi:hypothetical protein
MSASYNQTAACSGPCLLELLQTREAIAHVRMQLETRAFEAAWAEGHAMTKAEAVDSALSYLQARLGL